MKAHRAYRIEKDGPLLTEAEALEYLKAEARELFPDADDSVITACAKVALVVYDCYIR